MNSQRWGALWVLCWCCAAFSQIPRSFSSEAQEDGLARGASAGAPHLHEQGQPAWIRPTLWASRRVRACRVDSSGLPTTTETLASWTRLAGAPSERWRETGRTLPDCTAPSPLPRCPAVLTPRGRAGAAPCFFLDLTRWWVGWGTTEVMGNQDMFQKRSHQNQGDVALNCLPTHRATLDKLLKLYGPWCSYR